MSSSRLIKLILDGSDSDDDLETAITFVDRELFNKRKWILCQGSIQGHKYIFRNRILGHHKLFNDYFRKDLVYSPNLFRKRFRMSQSLFIRVQSAIETHDPYFVQRRNAAGTFSLSSLQKITAALRMLAYGVVADFIDEYIRIGESTPIESLKRFVKAVVSIFSDKYLRTLNKEDVVRLLKEGEKRGFPGMLGIIDCMHWKWKNCPVAWKGSHNDINVLDGSFLFRDLVEGRAPPANYSIKSNNYTMGYYLADGIYPPWSTFVKTIPFPVDNKHKQFATSQESVRKHVERAFGVLQSRFAIVRGLARFWHRETLKDIMKACIILHNTIVEDEQHTTNMDFNYDAVYEVPNISVSHEHTIDFLEFIQGHYRIRDRNVHSQLQRDLIEHIWNIHGGQSMSWSYELTSRIICSYVLSQSSEFLK